VEALLSLTAANEMKSMGKGEKALKLIEHGIALAPRNADLLNGYGELIETLRNDIVTADRMYFQVCSHESDLYKSVDSCRMFVLGSYT